MNTFIERLRIRAGDQIMKTINTMEPHCKGHPCDWVSGLCSEVTTLAILVYHILLVQKSLAILG